MRIQDADEVERRDSIPILAGKGKIRPIPPTPDRPSRWLKSSRQPDSTSGLVSTSAIGSSGTNAESFARSSGRQTFSVWFLLSSCNVNGDEDDFRTALRTFDMFKMAKIDRWGRDREEATVDGPATPRLALKASSSHPQKSVLQNSRGSFVRRGNESYGWIVEAGREACSDSPSAQSGAGEREGRPFGADYTMPSGTRNPPLFSQGGGE